MFSVVVVASVSERFLLSKDPVVVFIGQDEAIFKQLLLPSKMWTRPGGERPLLPKDEGSGLMIRSSLICIEYGLIREL